MSKLLSEIAFDFNRLQVTKDGDSYYVHLNDFINLQESPSIFFDPYSWQGLILREWWNATPLIHLPLIELIRIQKRLLKLRGEND